MIQLLTTTFGVGLRKFLKNKSGISSDLKSESRLGSGSSGMKNFGVYILESEKSGRYYIGSTDDIVRRLNQHNLGSTPSTSKFRPWVLKVFIKCISLSEARVNEYRLKKYKRRDILDKVIKDKIFPWNY